MRVRFQDVWEEASFEAWMLLPLSALYAAGWLGYLAVYALGFKKPSRPHCPMVCVGNLMVGGSGKTPTTLAIARLLRERGHKVVVSVSGYGSPRAQAASLAPDGPLDATEWGDEGTMLRWLVPDLPLIVGRDRVRAAEVCHESHPEAVMLMDDGYQHLRLAPDVRIVIDPEDLDNRFCMPAGPYREPRRIGLKRADLVLPGKFEMQRYGPILLSVDAEDDPTELKGLRADVLCALGRPQSFLASLHSAGVDIATMRLMPDHDRLDAGTLLNEFDPSLPLLVTAKDWVKLKQRPDIGNRKVLIATYEVEIEPREEFGKWLEQRIDESKAKTTVQ